MDIEKIMEGLKSYTPMTLEEAKRRRTVFMERYGNELTRKINDSYPTMPEKLIVPREVMEAVEAAFQHWPLHDEHGEEYVGNCCFRDPKITYNHVLFKGIPITAGAEE